MKIIKQISTHKAVKDGKEIKIYEKGMDPNAINPDGTAMWDESDKVNHPSWFKDELLYIIPSDEEDDVWAIMERLEENNRINVAELNGEF